MARSPNSTSRNLIRAVAPAALGFILACALRVAADVPTAQIVRNGYVPLAPEYPYEGHGYDFDFNPGDNDLPALRAFSIEENIFAGVDMSKDWNDREWDMIVAIVRHTSTHFPWSGTDSAPVGTSRALPILLTQRAHPEFTWGCGTISYAAIGLAQAWGIPARRVGSISEYSGNGDICCEMFSTHYNRWIFLFPHTGQWISHEGYGPLGTRDLHAYDFAGYIQTEVVDGLTYAVPHPPLVFMPMPGCNAPIWPFNSSDWWSGFFQHCNYTTRNMQNYSDHPTASPIEDFVVSDDAMNQVWDAFPPLPIARHGSEEFDYPINNVQAEVDNLPNGAVLKLRRNMRDFTHYQWRIGWGPWLMLDLPRVQPGVDDFIWQFNGTALVTIRGVASSGVQSPEVVIAFGNVLFGDADGNGTMEAADWHAFGECMGGPGRPPFVALPDDPIEPCLQLFDWDRDGDVDLEDARFLGRRPPILDENRSASRPDLPPPLMPDRVAARTAASPAPADTAPAVQQHRSAYGLPPPGMVYVPTGDFLMGDALYEGNANELPVHFVFVRGFHMDAHPVTNQEYVDGLNWALAQGDLISVVDGVVVQLGGGANEPLCSTTSAAPWQPNYGNYAQIDWTGSTFFVGEDRADYPVVFVSWYGAACYANWLSMMQGRTPLYDTTTWELNAGSGYRLPRSAEWEKAARGGSFGGRFPWGDVNTIDQADANYFSSPSFSYDLTGTSGFHPDFSIAQLPYTNPVGYFPPNAYGLYDMAGNVWEWCNDFYAYDYYAESPYRNPTGPATGRYRALRGGSWYNKADDVRCAVRTFNYPEARLGYDGFRLVLPDLPQ